MKSFHLSAFVFTVLCSILIVSCKEDAASPSGNNKQIWPLAVNNYWIYSDVEQLYFDTVKVTSSEVVDGISEFTIISSSNKPAKVKCDAAGNYYNDGRITMRYPTFVGDTIARYNSGSALVTTSINTVITTPAGTFTTVVYDIKDIEYRKIHYYSPSVGLIKYSYYEKSETNDEYELKDEIVLREYKLY